MSEAQIAAQMAADAAREVTDLEAFENSSTFELCPPLVQSIILDRLAWMRSIVADHKA